MEEKENDNAKVTKSFTLRNLILNIHFVISCFVFNYIAINADNFFRQCI